jgi:hypothetical protein
MAQPRIRRRETPGAGQAAGCGTAVLAKRCRIAASETLRALPATGGSAMRWARMPLFSPGLIVPVLLLPRRAEAARPADPTSEVPTCGATEDRQGAMTGSGDARELASVGRRRRPQRTRIRTDSSRGWTGLTRAGGIWERLHGPPNTRQSPERAGARGRGAVWTRRFPREQDREATRHPAHHPPGVRAWNSRA